MYVNDAFETAHRSHASLVGFPLVLDGGIGRVMEEELNHLETVIRREEIRRPCVYVLGGSKFEDTSVLIEHLLYTGRVDHILTTGNIANLFLCVKGLLNERFFDQEHLKRAKRILERGKDKIKVPKDVAIEIEGKREEVSIHDVDPPARQQAIYDIGMETCQEYAAVLRDARTIVMKGPAGVYERKEFIAGTKKIFEAIARSAETFSLISGGDTTSALRSLGLSKDKFSYVSLAGGSLLRYLAGEKLPALEVLKKKKR
jgi:phosphoglycerate kinase